MKKHTKRKEKEWAGRQADQRVAQRSNYVGAPSAGKEILKTYEDLLLKAVRGKKKFRACVFGATPETRDLVLKHGGDLTTIDISWEMIQKYNGLMKYAGKGNDTIIKADWLENPLADNYYDVVLGDGVLNNVDKKDYDKFLRKMKSMLKRGGYMILREGVLGGRKQQKMIEEINNDFMKGKIHWFDMFLWIFLNSDITEKVYDPIKKKTYMSKLWKEIEKAYRQRKLSKKAFDAMWWFRGNLIHTFVSRKELEKSIKKHFKLLPVRQAKDYLFSQDTFLFFFGKVKK